MVNKLVQINVETIDGVHYRYKLGEDGITGISMTNSDTHTVIAIFTEDETTLPTSRVYFSHRNVIFVNTIYEH